ncbi:MAG: hypothetical protein DMD59_03345 [Gemmatimonadetes bacterium]|nr:MAG: hypothetical protein DMD59_03345 [Gemmatimonadota bacterium]
MLLSLACAGAVVACSDAGGVDPDAIPGPELIAVRMALDSAFVHDTALDPAFTGDSGLYALMSALVFPFMDRATRIPAGSDTTRVVGIEFDIDATQGGSHVTSNLTAILAWKGYQAATNTMDTVFFLLGSGRAPVMDSLWSRFTLDTAGTGTGFVIHQATDSTVTTWLSRGGHLHTTSSAYGTARGTATFNVARGTLNGDLTITAKLVPDSTTTVTSALDFGSGARAVKVQIRGTLP